MFYEKDNELEQRLQVFLDARPKKIRSDSKDSDEIAEKIDQLLRDYKVPRMTEPEQQYSIQESINQRSASLQSQKKVQKHKENVKQSLSLKLLNQIKLMIKPPDQLVLLTASLVQLFGGVLTVASNSPFTISQFPTWPEVKSLLISPVEILQLIQEFGSILNEGRVKRDNIITSMWLINQAQQKQFTDVTESGRQITSMVNALSETINKLHKLGQAHFRLNNHSVISQPRTTTNKKRSVTRSLSQSFHNSSVSSVTKKLFATQTRQNLKKPNSTSKLSTPKVQSVIHKPHLRQNNSIRKISTSRSQSRSMPKYNDLQKRVQIAQQKKQKRIDRILNLQVKKPIVESQVKLLREGKSSQRESKMFSQDPITQQRVALQEEVALNQAAIRALKHEELEIKWRVEREAKQLQNQFERQAIADELERRRRDHDLTQENALKSKLERLKSQRQKTNESLIMKQKQSHMRNSRYLDWKENVNQSQVSDTQSLRSLQADYICTQKQKEQLEVSLHKIINNINHHGLSETCQNK